MLQLKQITKIYQTGDARVEALNSVSLNFRPCEFVSVLGPSGCGKTTLLNIIGGLDRATSGDLSIDGVSTEHFRDRDWDTYRNHRIGFVFQNYHLIPHQTALSNVELALTLTGIPAAERRRRATEALRRVGLGDQLRKKPNQLSGGQAQRVALARAMVNNPDILLADEPTGALDSETSVQVMELLKEIARDRLVILVTHNERLARDYSTRIVNLLDGRVVGDTDPPSASDAGEKARTVAAEPSAERPSRGGRRRPRRGRDRRTSMSFLTACSLSLHNLMTKKGRAAMTTFAGSIGIIGIALILALSHGIDSYIETVQKDTLSTYPLQINRQVMNMTDVMTGMMSRQRAAGEGDPRQSDRVYENPILTSMLKSMKSGVATNNLKTFKKFLDGDETVRDRNVVSAVQYTYDITMHIYKEDTSNGVVQVNPSQTMALLMSMVGLGATNDRTSTAISGMYGMNVWTEMLDNPELLQAQYELLDASSMRWPRSYDEVVIVVNEHNELSDVSVFALGLRDGKELKDILRNLHDGETPETSAASYSYDDLMNLAYRVVLPADLLVPGETPGSYVDKSGDQAFLKARIAEGIELKVVGIVRKREGVASGSISGTVGYTHALTERVIRATNEREPIRRQLADSRTDILTGLEFDVGQYDDLTVERKASLFRAYADGRMPASEKSAAVVAMLQDMTEEEKEGLLSALSEEERRILTGRDLSACTDAELDEYLASELGKYPSAREDFLLTLMGQDAFRAYLAGAVPDTLPPEEQERTRAFIRTASPEQLLASWRQQQPAEPQTPEAARASLLALMRFLPREERLRVADAVGQAEVLGRLNASEGTLEQMATLFHRALAGMDDAAVAALFDARMPPLCSDMTREQVLRKLGWADEDDPASIAIYASGFESKDQIIALVDQYNAEAEREGRPGDAIRYNDYIGVMMSFFTDMINVVSYVLIAFVSVSLVVSSIMIGIITYISVLERTKEIGILRAMGASKRDVARVFNAETLIIGFAAGLFGVLVTALACLPINAIIRRATGIPILTAALPLNGALILMLISVLLTMAAGLIPSISAARKDPVAALRTE